MREPVHNTDVVGHVSDVSVTRTPIAARTEDCPHRPACPGCPLFGLPVGEQLEAKRARLLTALARYPELSAIDVESVEAADPMLGYRRRAKWIAGARGALGLYADNGHDVVDCPECRILSPALHEASLALRHALSELEPPIDGVDLRDTSSGVLLTLISRRTPEELRSVAHELARRIPRIASIAASRREDGAVQLLGRKLTMLYGPDSVEDRPGSGDLWTFAAHGAFVQAHPAQAATIRAHIVRTITGTPADARASLAGRRVLELHAGSGALALELGRAGARVTAVEQFVPAAELARRAAHAQNLEIEVLTGDALEHTVALAVAGRRFDAIVVNPPRRGLAARLRPALAALAPKVAVYVSCEPETLARDLADLRRLGLTVADLRAYDMIPQSAEVETLVELRPEAAPRPRVIFEDERLIAVVKAPHEPTTPQGGRDDSLLGRVRLLDGAALAVPVHRLDAGTSGVCLFARKPEFVHGLAEALRAGEKRYTALVVGVTRDKGVVNRPLREQNARVEARTRYRRERVIGGHSLLTVRPDQGHKHQIRRHLAEVGHPVLGDERYGHAPSNRHFEHKHGLERPFLHCASIALELDGNSLLLRAPLAGDLDSVLDGLSRVPFGSADLDGA